MEISNDKYWNTSDYHLAAFLYARGTAIVGIEAPNGRPVFAFLNTAERQQWHKEYQAGTPTINVRLYVYALRELRQRGRRAVIDPDGTN
jgi:hypothetical protein